MNYLNDVSDEEFVPFLNGLGVETYKKSFEWMLNDPDFSDVLRWLYNNLDQNNALSAREEYRYTELQKKGKLLSTIELESTLSTIQQEYTNICLPGDQEAVEILKLDMKMQKERLTMLENHESTINNLVRQNEMTKEELDVEVAKLNAAQHQCAEDEALAAQECLQLAEDVDALTDNVVDVIAETLDMYRSCSRDKENAKKFFAYGPFELYKQSQALFRSHFDLYTSKKFNKRADNDLHDDLRSALLEAKSMEDRLSDSLCAYIESKAELAGEQAKLALVANYNNVHPSQIASHLMEAQNAIQLLEQEELILDQQIQNAVQEFVEERTSLAVETTTGAALAVREQIHKDLTFLLDITQQALAVDRVLYSALRHELRSTEELLHFASHLRLYALGECDAVRSRIQSMNETSSEHASSEFALQTSDAVLNMLRSVLGIECDDPVLLVKRYNDMVSHIRELRDSVNEGFNDKERALEEYKQSTKPLTNYIWDGCTKQPNCYNRTLASMTHSLRQEIDRVDKMVVDASSLFNSVKTGDKHNLRKLWQWFLTDPAKLFSAIKNMQSKSYT